MCSSDLEVAIVDKWQRAKCAVENGVDLVIELPYIYANQSASHFAEAAVELLKLCRCDYIVFGSESNDLETLKEIASLNINVDNLKESMKTGQSYVASYSLLQGSYPPNDILGIAYLKQIAKTSITPLCIKRTTDYHNPSTTGTISSATSIRKLVCDHLETSKYTPIRFEYHNTNQYYFTYLKTLLLSLPKEYLNTIFLMNEGIENHLVKCIKQSNDYNEFIDLAITRRYTKSRIQRVCMNILNQITYQQRHELEKLNFIRPLAFNTLGQKYLASLKKDEIIIASRFGQIPENYRKMEYKTSLIYTMNMPNNLQKKILDQEIKGPIRITE